MNKLGDKIVLDNTYEVIEIVAEAIRHSEANKETARRLSDAHEYCQKYIMQEAWGKNVWHSILDDAIKLRKQLEATHGMGG